MVQEHNVISLDICVLIYFIRMDLSRSASMNECGVALGVFANCYTWRNGVTGPFIIPLSH